MSESTELFDNEYIQSKYYIVPVTREDILSQLKELSEMLKSNYSPCFHEGLCDGDNACTCYRNRDILEKIQKRIDKLKLIDKKDKKLNKQILELSFENESLFEEEANPNLKNTSNQDDIDSEDPLYMHYQEIVGKFLHECEIYCGCPNYCRSKNKYPIIYFSD